MTRQQKAVASVNGVSPTGWVVKTGQRYYAGPGHHGLETWTVFPKLAKVYHRQGWAQRMAERFGGQAVPLSEQVRPPDGHDKSSEPLRSP